MVEQDMDLRNALKIGDIKNIINIGNNGIKNQTALCDSIFTVKLKLPVNKITINIAELKINS